MHVRILLAAPTGRAAKRMSETTGHEAKTIHRLLEYSQAKGGFQCDDENPLDCDLLIVDEIVNGGYGSNAPPYKSHSQGCGGDPGWRY